jgi:transcriptional regulator with XRE-family HTH domain
MGAAEPADLAGIDAALGAVSYAAELRVWRERRGLSKRALAERMAYDRSYVIKIENKQVPPTEAFTRHAEDVLECGGALWAEWEAWKELQAVEPAASRRPTRGWPQAFDEVLGRLDAMQAQLDHLARLYAEVGAVRGQQSRIDDASSSELAAVEQLGMRRQRLAGTPRVDHAHPRAGGV